MNFHERRWNFGGTKPFLYDDTPLWTLEKPCIWTLNNAVIGNTLNSALCNEMATNRSVFINTISKQIWWNAYTVCDFLGVLWFVVYSWWYYHIITTAECNFLKPYRLIINSLNRRINWFSSIFVSSLTGGSQFGSLAGLPLEGTKWFQTQNCQNISLAKSKKLNAGKDFELSNQ